jgi:hypothetical protein
LVIIVTSWERVSFLRINPEMPNSLTVLAVIALFGLRVVVDDPPLESDEEDETAYDDEQDQCIDSAETAIIESYSESSIGVGQEKAT